MSEALWTEAELTARAGRAERAARRARRRRVDRHPHASARRPVFRHQGRGARRPRPCRARLRGGRGGGRGRASRAGAISPLTSRSSPSTTPCARWSGSRARRARAAGARIVAVTGSVGKTSAKEMLRVALAKAGPTHASAASYNNHWGVPLTLARLPARRRLRRLRDRHEPRRRDRAAGRVGAPARRAHHHDRAGAYRISRLARGDRRRQGGDLLRPRAGRRGDPQSRRAAIRPAGARRARARRAGAELRRRRAMRRAPARRRRGRRRIARSRASCSGASSTFALGAPGGHMAENALGVLLAADALGGRPRRRRRGARRIRAAKGARRALHAAGPSGPFTLIDESYNANPASMRAALALLGAARPGAARASHRRHRRHAGAGRRAAPTMHAALAPELSARPRRSAVRRRAADARAVRRGACADARGLGRARRATFRAN